MGKAKKETKETQNFLVSAMVVVIAAIGFIGGFVLAGDLKERIYRANDNNKSTSEESSSIVIAGGSKERNTYGFDEKYVVSDALLDYSISFGTYAGSTDSYFTVEYGDAKNSLKITKYFYDSQESQEYSMNFSRNVVDVFLGSFDNDPQYNTLFFLLDNGDICYALIEEIVQKDDYGSYISISDISNVVKFYKGNSCDPVNGGCKDTTFAQTMDGKIYDLIDYVA